MTRPKSGNWTHARRPTGRRAFSLIELAAVLVIVGLLAAAGLTRWGSNTVQNLSGEGFARRLALDLVQARRRTIATGDNHYLQLSPSAGSVANYTMYRRAAGGDTVVEQTRTVPSGVTASASHATLEFDFDGASLATYSMAIVGPNRTWTITTVMATGAVQTATTP
jgi:prepilin-type N-terminal cleavage/methylation domain-containing protein